MDLISRQQFSADDSSRSGRPRRLLQSAAMAALAIGFAAALPLSLDGRLTMSTAFADGGDGGGSGGEGGGEGGGDGGDHDGGGEGGNDGGEGGGEHDGDHDDGGEHGGNRGPGSDNS